MQSIFFALILLGPLFGAPPPPTAMPSYYKASVAMSRLELESPFASNATMAWLSNNELELLGPSSLTMSNNQKLSVYASAHFKFQADKTLSVTADIQYGVGHPVPEPTLPSRLESHPAFENKRVDVISHGDALLIVADINQPTAELEMGSGNSFVNDKSPMPKQAWLTDIEGRTLTPLFFTQSDFGYEWTQKAHYIVAFAYCYGDNLGSGLYIFDVRQKRIHTLLKKYGGHCEGGNGFKVSPNEKYIVFQDDVDMRVSSMDGKTPMGACEKDEFVRAYVWSDDGRYLYLSCGLRKQDGTDSLRRLDTRSGKRVLLVDRTKVTFKAIRLTVSPDQKRVAFEWGNGTFVNTEQFGYWVIDMQLAIKTAK